MAGMRAQAQRTIPLEDAEVVEQVRSGKTAGFARLVEKYQDRVFNTCYRICGNAEDARDLTQEAFVRAFERLDTFGQRSGFYTWLFRIAVNLAFSAKRREHRAASLDAALLAGGSQASGLLDRGANGVGSPDRDGAGLGGELQRRVSEALEGLPPDQRALVVLRDIEGMDYQEIGLVLEIPLGTVKSRLFRARLSLREALQPYLGE